MVKFEPEIREMLKLDHIKFLILKHTGEEILAYVLQNEDDNGIHYYLFNPVKITNMVNPLTGGLQYLMSEWVSQRITDDEGFEIRVNDVLLLAGVEKGLKVSYMTFCEKIESFRQEVAERPSTDVEISSEDDSLSEETDDDVFLDVMAQMVQSKKLTVH